MNIGWKTQRASLLALLTGILLVGLAVLQYRWVGELSEFEYRRMQRTLRASSEGLARDFDREFRRIRSSFDIGRAREEEIFEEYSEWLASSDFPEIVADVFWATQTVPETPALLTLKQLDRQSGQLKDVEWPPFLAPVAARLTGMAFDNDRNRGRTSRTMALEGGYIALIVSQDDRRIDAWAIVLLQRDALSNVYIPSLIERYFGPGEVRDFDIWIVGRGRDRPIVYASRPEVPLLDPEQTDVQEEVSATEWLIAAQHQTGSLEAFVSQYRRRNLTLGIGTVLVLGASFVLLAVAVRRAQWVAERQMEFVAGVSHELRTPIAGISSLSQNLADGVIVDAGRVAEYGKTINNESHRLKDMVEKVLHFSAVQSGIKRYNLEPVDLQAIVERELETVRHTDGSGAATLDVEADLPPVLGDEQALRSVVRNLISNAVKFSRNRGPVVVSARRVESANPCEVELRVEDRGDGIDPSDMPHIFEPFYRGRNAHAGQISGSGLGLSLVREIVKEHHGRIEVTTRAGEGSTFRVYLPAVNWEGDGDTT